MLKSSKQWFLSTTSTQDWRFGHLTKGFKLFSYFPVFLGRNRNSWSEVFYFAGFNKSDASIKKEMDFSFSDGDWPYTLLRFTDIALKSVSFKLNLTQIMHNFDHIFYFSANTVEFTKLVTLFILYCSDILLT